MFAMYKLIVDSAFANGHVCVRIVMDLCGPILRTDILFSQSDVSLSIQPFIVV